MIVASFCAQNIVPTDLVGAFTNRWRHHRLVLGDGNLSPPLVPLALLPRPLALLHVPLALLPRPLALVLRPPAFLPRLLPLLRRPMSNPRKSQLAYPESGDSSPLAERVSHSPPTKGAVLFHLPLSLLPRPPAFLPRLLPLLRRPMSNPSKSQLDYPESGDSSPLAERVSRSPPTNGADEG
jgi:hypothetical protein